MKKKLALLLIATSFSFFSHADQGSKIIFETRLGGTIIDASVFKFDPRVGFDLLFQPTDNFRGGLVFSFDSGGNSLSALKDEDRSLFGIHHWALENQFRVMNDLWFGFNVGFLSMFRKNAAYNEILIYGDRWVMFEANIRYEFNFDNFFVAPVLSAMFQGGRQSPIVYLEGVAGVKF